MPGILTIARVPLAALFPFVASRPPAAFAVLVAAACTDVLDGWWARRFGQVSSLGAALDPITDKVFALSVGVSLVGARVLSPVTVLLLGTREIGEALLVLWCASGPARRRARAGRLSANLAGKFVTVLQFVAVCSALGGAPYTAAWVAAVAVTGAGAAVLYWRRAVSPGPASPSIPAAVGPRRGSGGGAAAGWSGPGPSAGWSRPRGTAGVIPSPSVHPWPARPASVTPPDRESGTR